MKTEKNSTKNAFKTTTSQNELTRITHVINLENTKLYRYITYQIPKKNLT